jgi:hypothetical protein
MGIDMRIDMKRALRGAALGWGTALGLGVGVANANAAAPLPMADIDARVSYETRQVMASGVTRIDTWAERLVRRGHQTWTERIRPPAAHAGRAHETVAEPAGHKHFNAETSARWLTLAPDGEVEVRFVDAEHKVVVSVPRAEFGTVGFDGQYGGAASIVPVAVVRAMKPAPGASSEGAWYTDRSHGWSHRVLWSESRQLALRVESQRDDGSVHRIVTVKLLPAIAGQPAPWSRLADHTQKNYDDFMD